MATFPSIVHRTKSCDNNNNKIFGGWGISFENEDHLWEETIEQEMKNGRVAFQTCDGNIEDSIGHEQITCHLIFCVKLLNVSDRKQGLQLMGTRFQLPHQ